MEKEISVRKFKNPWLTCQYKNCGVKVLRTSPNQKFCTPCTKKRVADGGKAHYHGKRLKEEETREEDKSNRPPVMLPTDRNLIVKIPKQEGRSPYKTVPRRNNNEAL